MVRYSFPIAQSRAEPQVQAPSQDPAPACSLVFFAGYVSELNSVMRSKVAFSLRLFGVVESPEAMAQVRPQVGGG